MFKVFKDSIKTIVSSNQAWLIAALYFFIYTPLSCLADTWGVSYLTEVYQINKIEAAEICLRIYIGIAIGTPIIGVLSNKIHSRKKPLIICALLTVLIFATIFYLPNLPLIVIQILFILLGFFLGGQKLVFTMICELTPKRLNGIAIGFVNSVCMVNGILLPTIVGKCLFFVRNNPTSLNVISTFQEYSFAFIIPVICLVLALIISFFIRETYYLTHERTRIDYGK